MEVEDDAGLSLAFFVRNFFFGIRGAEEGEDKTVHTGTGFDDVGDVTHTGLVVEVLHRFAAGFLVGFEVEITAGSNALQLLGSEGELEKDIDGGLGVMGQFLRFLPVFLEHGARKTDPFIPLHALFDPVEMPGAPAPVFLGLGPIGDFLRLSHVAGDFLHGLVGTDEVFQLHLFEFAGTEGEVARGDFVAEGFPDLADAEGDLLAGGFQDIAELDEDGLGRFGTEVGHVLFRFNRPDKGLEHEIERTRFGFLAFAFGGGDFGMPRAGGFVELIGAESGFAEFAVDHEVDKGVNMPGGLPDLGMHDDGGVDGDDVVPAGHFFPPELADVPFQLGA